MAFSATNILMAPMKCGGSKDTEEVRLMPNGLIALTPAAGLLKEVEKVLPKTAPSLSDTEPVKVGIGKQVVGNHPLVRAMAAKRVGIQAERGFS